MKKFFLALCMVAFLAACDDSSSASSGPNDEPGVESSSSVELSSSSSEKAKSSSSDTPSDVKQSSSSEKSGKSSCSANDALLSSEKQESSSSAKSSSSAESSSSEMDLSSSSSAPNDEPSSSSVIPASSQSSSSKEQESSSSIESSSSSAEKVDCSKLLKGKKGRSWDVPKECYLNPNITYGSMTDERDGKVYRTVIISGDVWMAENLNYDPGLGGSDSTKYEWSWCYYNEPKNCDVAGRLYTWAAAIDSVSLATDADNPMDCGLGKTCTLPDTLKGICPPGWHLPNKDEWSDLFYVVGGGGSTVGKCLKSRIAWSDASDNVGFSALPAGGWFDEDTGFYDDLLYTYFWGSNEYDEEDAYNMGLYDEDTFEHLKVGFKSFGFSVRCIKNR